MADLSTIHPDARGLRLYRHDRRGYLIACELVMFVRGRQAVRTTLYRASISGIVEVEPFDGPMDYFADVHSDEYNFVQTVRLDRGSYAALKNKWMRCKIDRDAGTVTTDA